MQRVSVGKYYQIGARIHPLCAYNEETILNWKAFYEIYEASKAVGQIISENHTYHVCQSSAHELNAAIWAILPPLEEIDSKINANQKLGQLGIKLSGSAVKFETIFAAELETLDTYFVSKKSIFSTRDLIEKSEYLLPSEILEKCAPETISELKQAGKCIAFECATASAFHVSSYI